MRSKITIIGVAKYLVAYSFWWGNEAVRSMRKKFEVVKPGISSANSYLTPMDINPGQLNYRTKPSVRSMLLSKDEAFRKLGDENAKQPTVALTAKQIFELLDCTEVQTRHFNSLYALAGGEIESCIYFSVILTKKET